MKGPLPTLGREAVTGTGTATAPDRDSLDAETLFEVLGNERRRACLQRLAEHDTGLSVSDLGREVARSVADEGTESDAVYDSVYVSLCQTHLPKLDAVGLIEYNRDQKLVAHGPQFEAVRRQFRASHPTDQQPGDTGRTDQQQADRGRTGAAVSAVTATAAVLAVLSPPAARTILLLGLAAVHLFTLASSVALSYEAFTR